MIRIKENLNEREFELVNIIGAEMGSNQRNLSRQLNLSLGMVNMLIRRLISKGYIRIRQLNQRKVEYILTPRGFSEKMRKSVKYTVKTLHSISLIREGVERIIVQLKKEGAFNFVIVGHSDLAFLVEMVIRQKFFQEPFNIAYFDIDKINDSKAVLLICQEEFASDHQYKRTVNLITELAKQTIFARRASLQEKHTPLVSS